jgi:hypothetical protein
LRRFSTRRPRCSSGRGRLTYGTLKRQFLLDDAALEDLTNELIKGQRLARDEDGAVLVWTGAVVPPPTHAPTPPPATAPAPLAYTPPYLVEKILTTRSALEGERKQVTVLFADLKGSTELIRDLDPEAAQTLLDPALHGVARHPWEYPADGGDPQAGRGTRPGQRPGAVSRPGAARARGGLCGASAMRRRLQAAAARGLTRFVGR